MFVEKLRAGIIREFDLMEEIWHVIWLYVYVWHTSNAVQGYEWN